MGPRLAASIVLSFILLVLDTTVFAWWSLGPLKLLPLIPMAVSAGFRLAMLPGVILVLFIGYCSDVLSAGVVGLQLTAFQVVYLMSAVAERRLEINSWPLQMLAVGLMTIVFQLIIAVGLNLMDQGYLDAARLSWIILAQALLSAITAPAVFGALEYTTNLAIKLWPSDGRTEA
jgi:cell shape-determining protein MreD